ncbi:MAG: hypothetical protein ISS45_07645 [Candidatus Omnitrophica bacterium]|nr:hypothetical protein [Candidatus Omnitrophota bacterium]
MVYEECEEKDFKKKLQNIIDSLEWFGFEKCSECKTTLKHSVLDGDEGIECPSCGMKISGDLFPNPCEKYQNLFLEAIREAMRIKIEGTNDFRHPYLDAFTSYELFLRQIVSAQFKKTKLNENLILFISNRLRDNKSAIKEERTFLERVEEGKFKETYLDEGMISYIFDITKPNIWFYLKVLKNLGLKLGEKIETIFNDIKSITEKTGEIRNKITHIAKYPSEQETLDAFGKIANAFHILAPYSIFDKKRKIETEWV